MATNTESRIIPGTPGLRASQDRRPVETSKTRGQSTAGLASSKSAETPTIARPINDIPDWVLAGG